MKKIDLTGRRIGYLTVINEVENADPKKGIIWSCKCDCGSQTNVRSYLLCNELTKSCGCLKKEAMSKTMKTHGMSDKTPLYRVWAKMKERCISKNCKSFKDYGGRGISVCKEWVNDFKAFYDWAISHGYKENVSIDRINVNGNYHPDNCRFLSMKGQQQNRRNNKIIEYKGEFKPLAEWCDILGLNYSTTHQRIHKYNWSIEKSFTLNN